MIEAAAARASNRSASPARVFVVSTGRSGTRTLADLLSALPGCVVAHELEPKLLTEVLALARGQVTHAAMVDLLRRTRDSELIGGARLSGEANQRLSFVLPALAEAFPEARYLWLIRDGRAAVSSMVHRGWYHPREVAVRAPAVRQWAATRLLAHEVGDLSASDWQRLDAFGRCCWYWAYTNRVIAADIARLRLPSVTIRLEELSSELPGVLRFLGVGEHTAAVPRSNSATAGRPMSWHLWSRRQRATFDRLCGIVMDEHYPGWRDEMSRGVADELAALARRAGRDLRRIAGARSRPLRARWRSPRSQLDNSLEDR